MEAYEPMIYSVGGEDHVLEIHIGGAMTKAGILNLWDSVEHHSTYLDATAAFVSLRPGLCWNVEDSEISELANMSRRFKPLRWAIFAPDQLSYGMSRMFAAQVDNEKDYGVFRDDAAAREWISSR